MGRYKPKPSDLHPATLETLKLVMDGADVTGKQDTAFMREVDRDFPGIVKFGPPLKNALASFSVRCTPKGRLLVEAYLRQKQADIDKAAEAQAAKSAQQEIPTHGE